MRARTLTPLGAALALAGALPAAAAAQVRASERGMVAQTVDGTTITVEYYRPVARGRDSLIGGGVVRWGETWTPGANWATTLEVDKDVRVNGSPLPKGKYSVWMVPRPDAEWTVILSRAARLFHTVRPQTQDEQLRFAVRPEQGPHAEVLSWYFPAVARDGTTLRMHWGTTYVPLRITVQPTRPNTIGAAERAAYLGAYQVTEGGAPGGMQMVVTEEDGRLRARATPALFGMDPEFDLIPAGRHRFHSGFYKDGTLFDVDAETTIVFLVERGRAAGFEVRGVAGEVIARGELTK